MRKQAFTFVISFISFAVTYCINFFLSPYISANLPGTYGYIKLANDFVNYASMITLALNSMAGRFITIEFNKGDLNKANKYYSSVLFANIILTIVLAIPLFVIVFNLDGLINIDPEYLSDVQLLFTFSFISFLLGILFSVYSLSTFIKDRLDLAYYVEIFTNILRAVLLFILLGLFEPKVYYVGLTALIMNVVWSVYNFFIKKKLMPEFKINIHNVSVKYIRTLVFAGMWNSIQKLGQILLDGLDILISNLFINSLAMNNLSFAKTMPGIIAALLNKVAANFVPNNTVLYAQGKMLELKHNVKNAMIFLSVIISIPIGIIISLGYEFYCLWLPGEDAESIYLLSTISCAVYIISTPMNAVYNLYTVLNKVRYIAILTLASGVISTLFVLVLLNFTNLGVIAVAGCSVIIGIIRNLVFVEPFITKELGLSPFAFYPEIFKSVISVVDVCIISYVVKQFISVKTWGSLCASIIIIGIVAFLLNIIILLNNTQRKILLNKLKQGVERAIWKR